MLSDFQKALDADKSLNPKHVPYLVRWVRDCYKFFRKAPAERLSLEQIQLYLSHLKSTREDWQIKQAEQALRRFDFFLTAKSAPLPVVADCNAWNQILAQTRDVLRVKQLGQGRGRS